MQQFWSVLAIVAMSWPSVSSAFTLEFSAEQTVRKGAQSMRGKIYFQPDRWRVEMASPDGPKVAIHRLDRAVTWLLLPNKTYVELPFRFDQIPQVAPKLEGEVGRKRVGKEQVGGRPTEKYEVTVEVNGRRQIMYQWVAQDIQFAMKTASADGSWESAYAYVNLGKQPAHLFEIPAGYTKVPMQR